MQANATRGRGRPRRNVDVERTKNPLSTGTGLREIARQLRLGYGTVHRIVRGAKSPAEVIQKSSAEVL